MSRDSRRDGFLKIFRTVAELVIRKRNALTGAARKLQVQVLSVLI